jgi:PRTRC genetic system protein C
MTETKKLTREFRFNKNNTPVKLPDPNPSFSAEEVLRFYAGQYPELTSATFSGPKVDGDKAVYSIETTVGTNG